MQALKAVSAIFLYQQMIVLKTLRKMLFIYLIKRFCHFQGIQIYVFLSSTLFPQSLLEKMIEINS